jgi:hypothetical protein
MRKECHHSDTIAQASECKLDAPGTPWKEAQMHALVVRGTIHSRPRPVARLETRRTQGQRHNLAIEDSRVRSASKECRRLTQAGADTLRPTACRAQA